MLMTIINHHRLLRKFLSAFIASLWLNLFLSLGVPSLLFAQPTRPVSPWPSFRSTPSLTGFAEQVEGPQLKPILYWQKRLGGAENLSPVVAEDGTIIFTSTDDVYVYGLLPSGERAGQWPFSYKFPNSNVFDTFTAPPTIGPDGTIYIGSRQDRLFAITSNGQYKWHHNLGSPVSNAANVDSQGTIYIVTDGSEIFAINPNNTLKWQESLQGNAPSNTPALDDHGRVYAPAASTVYVFDAVKGSAGRHLSDLDDLHEVYWAVAGPNGTILVGGATKVNSTIVRYFVGAFRPDVNATELAWKFPANGATDYPVSFGPPCMPALGPDGQIYFAAQNSGMLFALNSNGNKLCDFDLGNEAYRSMPIVDKAGRVYIFSSHPDHGLFALKSISSTSDCNNFRREPLWIEADAIKCPSGSCQKQCRHSLAFGPRETLYVVNENNLYALRESARPESFERVSVAYQIGCRNERLALPLQVRVRNQYDEPFANHPVRFQVLSGKGSPSDITIHTGSDGLAQIYWTLGPQLGLQQMQATATGLGRAGNGATLLFTALADTPRIGGAGTVAFGRVPINEVRTQKHFIRNAGTCSLRVIETRIPEPSSRFSLPNPIVNRWIKAGESLGVDIQFAPQQAGTHSANLILTSDDLRQPRFEVALTGEAFGVPDISVSPNLLDFGQVCVGDTAKQVLTISNTGTDKLIITRFEFSSPVFSTMTQSLTIDSNQSEKVPIAFTPTAARDYSNNFLLLHHNDVDENPARVDLTGKGTLKTSIRVTPLVLNFPAVCVGDTPRVAFMFRNMGCADLHVTNISSTNAAFKPETTRLTLPPFDSLQVFVRFCPTSAQAYSGNLNIVFEGENLTIPLSGSGAVPNLNAEKPIVFGEVSRCQSRLIEYTIRNNGANDIAIDSAWIAGEHARDFMIETNCNHTILNAGAPCLLKLRFTPKGSGARRASLHIASSDACEFFAELHGIGLPDTTAPAKPESLSVTPSSWKNRNDFTLTWKNPVDSCGVVAAYYKFGEPPKASNKGRRVDGENISRIDNLRARRNGLDTVYVWLEDRLENNDPRNHAFVILKFDSLAPAILHQPVVCVSADSAITISASATDYGHSGIVKHELYYRRGGMIAFRQVHFQNDKAIIPADFVKSQSVEYFITASDHAGNNTSLPSDTGVYSIQVKFSQDYLTSYFQPGENKWTGEPAVYRLHSFPFRLDDSTAAKALPEDIVRLKADGTPMRELVRLFDIDPQNADSLFPYREYPEVGDFRPGRAMFLITRYDHSLPSPAGKTVGTDKPFLIPLHKGWNLIASPFNFSISLQRLLPVEYWNCLFKFEGEWQLADPVFTFEPWQGYLVKSLRNGPDTLRLQPSLSRNESVGKERRASDEKVADWRIGIKALCGNAKDLINAVGVIEDANTEWDVYERFEPPPIGEYVLVYFPQWHWKKSPDAYTTDFRPRSSEGYEWHFEVLTNKLHQAVQLEFEGLSRVPPEHEVQLIDTRLNLARDLRQESQYIFRADSEESGHGFRLVVGSPQFVNQKLAGVARIPEKFELTQNFPNPFNASTAIKFGLPRTTRVSLSIYDTQGALVRKLIHGTVKAAGYHVAVWEGLNDEGNVVTSGIYFCRLHAGGEQFTRKLTFVK